MSSALKQYQELYANLLIFLDKRRRFIQAELSDPDAHAHRVRWIADFDVLGDMSALEGLVFVRLNIPQKRAQLLDRKSSALSLLAYLVERQVRPQQPLMSCHAMVLQTYLYGKINTLLDTARAVAAILRACTRCLRQSRSVPAHPPAAPQSTGSSTAAVAPCCQPCGTSWPASTCCSILSSAAPTTAVDPVCECRRICCHPSAAAGASLTDFHHVRADICTAALESLASLRTGAAPACTLLDAAEDLYTLGAAAQHPAPAATGLAQTSRSASQDTLWTDPTRGSSMSRCIVCLAALR